MLLTHEAPFCCFDGLSSPVPAALWCGTSDHARAQALSL